MSGCSIRSRASSSPSARKCLASSEKRNTTKIPVVRHLIYLAMQENRAVLAMREIFANLAPSSSTSNYFQDRYVINKVGMTSNLRGRRKAESYQNSHLKSIIVLDEGPLSVATALREEYTKMMRWIIDSNDGVKPPIRRLFATLTDSGAAELGPARSVIAQLLESVMAYDTRTWSS